MKIVKINTIKMHDCNLFVEIDYYTYNNFAFTCEVKGKYYMSLHDYLAIKLGIRYELVEVRHQYNVLWLYCTQLSVWQLMSIRNLFKVKGIKVEGCTSEFKRGRFKTVVAEIPQIFIEEIR